MSLSLNTKVYAYAGVVGNYSRYAYKTLGLAQLFSWATGWVSVGTKRVKGGAIEPTHVKWRLKVAVPVPGDSECGCSGDVKGEITAFIDITIDSSLDQAARTDFALRLKDLVGTPEFQGTIISLEQPYA